ncbi:class D sortase [Paenibacillus sp. J2TS4]|uniref:class D sortase n=1 Tax=Paenibacillus sp. J2TS4 TaxID=2807194 RepID=UPI001B066A3D|nr:class D sortase [Paenibacillus sp. J2TS4]GIP34186.1 hypothetical protein J2TS4_33960 [Paenibacillus sp. J2TS4]
MLILYPWWDRHIQEKKQLEMLAQWDLLQEKSSEPLSSEPVSKSPADSSQEGGVGTITIDGHAVLGTITIDKIDLRETVLEGTDKKTLKAGIGTIETDRHPGQPGNFALAGHRSWTYGKQFSRLDEMEEGDQIVIETQKDSYVYSVASKFLVEPDDLSVLDQNGDLEEVTLVTCEPAYNPTHRLIVKAIRID